MSDVPHHYRRAAGAALLGILIALLLGLLLAFAFSVSPPDHPWFEAARQAQQNSTGSP